MTMTKPTSEQVTFLAAGTGAVQRTALDKFRETVSVKDFGAVGDGVADDTAAIQAAIDACFGVGGLNPDALMFPGGNYKVTSPILWNRTVRLIGSNLRGSTIVAGAAMNAVIQASTSDVDTDLTLRSFISGINISGANLASFGIQGKTNHTTFAELRIAGTTQAAMDIGYGWCNTYSGIEMSSNSGDGLRLGVESNQCIIHNCKIFSNAGIGIVARGSRAVQINCTLLEECRKGGILFANSMQGFSIDTCYFESNGQDGIDFTVPALFNIKADIIVNGSAPQTQLANSFTCTGSIVNCFSSSAYTECFVIGNGLSESSVQFNRATGNSRPAVKYYGNPSTSSAGSFSYGSPDNVAIGPNKGFSDEIEIAPAGSTVYRATRAIAKSILWTPPQRNLAVVDFNQWSQLAAGDGGSFVRSASGFNGDASVPVWEIQASAGLFTTDTFGFSLDASTLSAYHNKWMMFGIWVKAPFTDDGWVDMIGNSTSTIAANWTRGTDWVEMFTAFKMPTTGSRTFGMRISTLAGTGASNVLVAAPVVCQLGANFDDLQGRIAGMTSFRGTAAPVAGTWKRGDVVMNSTPSAGGTPGWVCVTAGTPGTWKAMSNVAA